MCVCQSRKTVKQSGCKGLKASVPFFRWQEGVWGPPQCCWLWGLRRESFRCSFQLYLLFPIQCTDCQSVEQEHGGAQETVIRLRCIVFCVRIQVFKKRKRISPLVRLTFTLDSFHVQSDDRYYSVYPPLHVLYKHDHVAEWHGLLLPCFQGCPTIKVAVQRVAWKRTPVDAWEASQVAKRMYLPRWYCVRTLKSHQSCRVTASLEIKSGHFYHARGSFCTGHDLEPSTWMHKIDMDPARLVGGARIPGWARVKVLPESCIAEMVLLLTLTVMNSAQESSQKPIHHHSL